MFKLLLLLLQSYVRNDANRHPPHACWCLACHSISFTVPLLLSILLIFNSLVPQNSQQPITILQHKHRFIVIHPVWSGVSTIYMWLIDDFFITIITNSIVCLLVCFQPYLFCFWQYILIDIKFLSNFEWILQKWILPSSKWCFSFVSYKQNSKVPSKNKNRRSHKKQQTINESLKNMWMCVHLLKDYVIKKIISMYIYVFKTNE